MFKIIISVSFTLLLTFASFAQNKSIYTPISNEKCETKTTSPVSGYLTCPGAGGYNLQVLDDDARMSINVIAPDKKVFELDFWGYFRNFSSVGERAEWRMKGKTPIALIIRYNVSDKGDFGETTSYLLVTKITKNKACLTNIVKPSKNQNLTAQKLADSSFNKPCKKIEE